jgi:hypothetical protein
MRGHHARFMLPQFVEESFKERPAAVKKDDRGKLELEIAVPMRGLSESIDVILLP